MRTRRILVVLAAVLGIGLLATSQAQAKGNWAETVLDPPPARIQPNVTYTFGFWVLQHGSYPYKGDLGKVELRATDDEGRVVSFPVTALTAPAHYSAEAIFPHDGEWHLSANHEQLMPDTDVATVTVPGAVKISPSEVRQRGPFDWGALQPSFPPTADGAQVAAPDHFPEAPPALPLAEPDSDNAGSGDPADEASDPADERAADEPGAALPIELVIAAGLATIALAVWLARRYARANRSTG